MALFNADLSGELSQVKSAAKEILKDDVAPLIQESIAQAGHELSQVVGQASAAIQQNIRILSDEVHNQRSLTKDELAALIDYAADKIGKTVDERLIRARAEASALFAEKLTQLKAEFEDAAVRSRKTLYFNVAVSVGAAAAMAALGVVYKKISIGELDVFSVFRVALLSMASGTGVFALLKSLTHWRSLNRTKKNMASTAIAYLGVLRPNGALGLFSLCLLLLLAWGGITLYGR